MTRLLITAVVATASLTLLLQALRPRGAEASIPPPPAITAEAAFLPPELPPPQEPFDLTEITPVESTGAPTYWN